MRTSSTPPATPADAATNQAGVAPPARWRIGGGRGGRGQPRNTNLRRATSSAYYALFHAVALAVAGEALPNSTDEERYGYARYVNHSAIKQACDWVSGNAPPRHLEYVATRLRQNRDLSSVASAFVTLQEQRELADYDHRADFTRPTTLADLARARSAVDVIRGNSGTDDFRALFGLIALQTTIRRG